MRPVPLTLSMLLCAIVAAASEIREFDLRTTEHLGNELIRAIGRPDHGATTNAKRRAKETAVAALQGKLYDGVRYDWVVLDDPTGSGFLVYALAVATKKGDVTTVGIIASVLPPMARSQSV